jgi:GNAT superfamily N-acetyltransferase
MEIKIEAPNSAEGLTEFIQFYEKIHAYQEARWPAPSELQMAFFKGEVPTAEGRKIRPFVARSEGSIVARATAVVDGRYNRHWNERLGHIIMFEALPDSHDATKLLIDASCAWLKEQGAEAARTGFHFTCGDMPYVIDAYDKLPPDHLVRQNPSYYHSLLKGAHFESEKGVVDYKIEVRPELIKQWEEALEKARRAGYEIQPFEAIPEKRRIEDFTRVWYESYKAHWGFAPMTEQEVELFCTAFRPVGGDATTVIAYRGKEPVGAVLARPEISETAILKPGRSLSDDEKLNLLGIAVRESARGKGVNLAMAGYAYLELARRGAKYLSYTLVLDDNWPSRRTAEKLGASVCANYLIYRRNLSR